VAKIMGGEGLVGAACGADGRAAGQNDGKRCGDHEDTRPQAGVDSGSHVHVL
jgi:hypothetical protein